MIVRIVTLIFLILFADVSQAEKIIQRQSFAQLGEPKYPDSFSHFDYANPTAPKGGSITLSAPGTYDSFNLYALRGSAAAGSDLLYDRLFASSDDEPGSLYPLIASSARFPADWRWVEVTINPQARFQDGSPITAADAAFTFNLFMTQGVPQFRLVYKGIIAKVITPRILRFDLPHGDRDKVLSLLSTPVFPRAFWKNHNLAEPLSSPPPGSGPYRISAWKMGQSVTWSRVKDYWAANLPVNKGRFNFDTLRYDYYLDDNVAFEAFKAGAVDFRSESSAKRWATQYSGSNIRDGYIIKQAVPNQVATDTSWLTFNVHKPLFSDRRVRQALSLMFDFDWMNRTLFFNTRQRVNSYFQNTPYAARQLPDARERQILQSLPADYPPEALEQIYQPPKTDGSGFDRAKLVQALALLKQAGWELKNQRLIHQKTGKPFEFEMLLFSGGSNPWVMPFQYNLARVGITMNVRQVDSSQYLARLRKRDFDMLPTRYPAFASPTTDLQIFWASSYLNSTYNTSGASSPLLDQLIEQINQHQNDQAALLPLGRVLDRVLIWNCYMIPLWYSAEADYAWWDKFSHPAIWPAYQMTLNNWWYDAQKAAALPTQHR